MRLGATVAAGMGGVKRIGRAARQSRRVVARTRSAAVRIAGIGGIPASVSRTFIACLRKARGECGIIPARHVGAMTRRSRT
jgi:hypothetical protein